MTVEKACKNLLITDPFWGLLMLNLHKQYTTAIDTLGVRCGNNMVELRVNKDFWDSHSDKQQTALLLHELHHLCFEHLTMTHDFPNTKAFNMAADLEVNSYIDDLPDSALKPKHYGLSNACGTKFYYDWLIENKKVSDDTVDVHDWRQDKTRAKIILEREFINDMVKQTYMTGKEQGLLPGYMRTLLKDRFAERERVFDWKKLLRRILGTQVKCTPVRTHMRPSRRFQDTPGIKFDKQARVLVAVDTSSSVRDNELQEFFSEIMHMHKSGTSIHVLECDAEIQDHWEFKTLRNIPVSGRGGTNFQPAIDYYRKHLREFSTMVFFTDGYADTDNLDVPYADITWVITSDGCRKDYPGKTLYIPK